MEDYQGADCISARELFGGQSRLEGARKTDHVTQEPFKKDERNNEQSGKSPETPPQHLHWPRLPVDAEELPFDG
jgi:hypothetical protein